IWTSDPPRGCRCLLVGGSRLIVTIQLLLSRMNCQASVAELLVENALVPVVIAVKENEAARRRVLADRNPYDRAHFDKDRGSADRPLLALHNLHKDIGPVGPEVATPAPRPERADRRQRQQRRIDRQDRAMGGKIVGGRARRRRYHGAVADEFL